MSGDAFSMMRLSLTVLAIALGQPALAQEPSVSDCGWQSSARNLVEPWEDHSRSFANGDVRIALLDTVEPAAGAMHVLVLSPPFTELGDRSCQTVGAFGGVGFAALDFSALEAAYSPETGLGLTMPAAYRDPETGHLRRGFLYLELNQNTGALQADILADLQ